MLVGGPDGWHPNAEMFYRAGGGPLLDIAPYYLTAIVSLLGPIASVAGFVETPTPERTLGAGPRAGEVITVDVPDARGDRAAPCRRRACDADCQLRGARPVPERARRLRHDRLARPARRERVRRRRDPPAWPRRCRRPWQYASRGAQETRGLGIDELVEALRAGRPHRASGELALHVLEAAEAAVRAGEERLRRSISRSSASSGRTRAGRSS